MDIDCIPFKETGYFSKLICDYLDQHEDLRPFFNRYPKLENFAGQIQEKQASFPKNHRKVLVDALQKQYQDTIISEATSEHITRLADSKTFTVVTGHQLNLFTGPLYFLYKIVSTINLAQKLR